MILKNTIQNLHPYILDKLIKERIGFRGPDHAEETVDLLKDFASTANMLNKELDKKKLSADDPIVQEILTILDNNLSVDTEFLNDVQHILDLIQELPDKPEKQKIGFRQAVDELYINKKNKNG